MRSSFYLLCLFALAGCFGPKTGPDETLVVAGPELIMPPKFELTKPTRASETSSPAEKAANQRLREAQATLLGTTDTTTEPTTTETTDWILQDQNVNDNIREQLHIDREEQIKADAERNWLQKLEDALQQNEE